MLVTETWLQGGEDLDNLAADLRGASGIELISKNRPKYSNRNPGGGVAALYKKNMLSLSRESFTTKFEVLLCRVKMHNNTRPMFVFLMYFPPKLKAADVRECLKSISEKIARLKLSNSNPYILLAGDVNQFPVDEAIIDHNDINLLRTPPTRGNACLDILASNFNEEITETFVESPLESDIALSDHAVLVARASLKHKHDFKWITYSTRQIDDEGKRKFATAFVTFDWASLVNNIPDPTDLTVAIQEKIEELNNTYFPWKRRKIRSTDDPWITDKVRRAIRRRNRAYTKTMKRTDRWKLLKHHTNQLIAEEKLKYYEREEKKLHVYNPKAIPYKILKDLTEPERPAPWTVNNLRPDSKDEDIAEELAVYFSRITDTLPCLLYTSPSPRDRQKSRMPSSA